MNYKSAFWKGAREGGVEFKSPLVIGKPAPQAAQSLNTGPAGQPIPQGPTVYDANFEYVTRLNALNLADKLMAMTPMVNEDRAKRMLEHANLLIDQMGAPQIASA